ncbi:MAG: Smr/MutS family protein [Hyphomonadaceae bacterium]|nr:Smr/MutS family protein [Hyphomonadaceae bacterium]
MSKKRRDLTAEEKRLWRRAATGVKTRKPLPAAMDEPDEARVLRQAPSAAPPKTVLVPPRSQSVLPPQDRGNEKRVRRGKLEIGGKLDLHGHTQESGRAALVRFLHSAQARGDRTVIVITGVGRGGEGILRRRLPEWIAERDLRTCVSGFAPAHRTHGGAGAFYVFLKRTD